jgi:CBS domain-containing protein
LDKRICPGFPWDATTAPDAAFADGRRDFFQTQSPEVQTMPDLVRDIMTPSVLVLEPRDTLVRAAALMRDQDIGALPVGENDRLVGMLTDRDIVKRATAQGLSPDTTRVGEAMSRGVLYCFDDDTCEDVAASMAANQVRRLPVVSREKRLVGIVSLGDLANSGAEMPAAEALAEISRPTNGGLAKPPL